MSGATIRAEGLVKTFGEGHTRAEAVRDVNLVIGPGEVVLVMGPSGSGKTTLLSMLGAMLRPTSGRIEIDGVDLAMLGESKLPAFRARRFGFVFQDFNLLTALSAQENVEFALTLGGVDGRAASDRTKGWLGAMGLGERVGFRPEQLGRGEAAGPDRASPRERPGCDPRRRTDGEPRLEDRKRDRAGVPEDRHRGQVCPDRVP